MAITSRMLAGGLSVASSAVGSPFRSVLPKKKKKASLTNAALKDLKMAGKSALKMGAASGLGGAFGRSGSRKARYSPGGATQSYFKG